MRFALTLLTAVCAGVIGSCTAPGAEIEQLPASAPPAWTYDSAAASIAEASCGEANLPGQGFVPLELTAAPLDAKQGNVLAERLPARVRLAGAWELDSDDPNFGGLSGLAVLDGSTLLAISDAGGWFKLALADGVPASASAGYMRGPDGTFLNGKDEADAEGLALRNGTAFVSFERNFRIAAFALSQCGASAKAVPVAALPSDRNGVPIAENEGPEALWMTPSGELQFGYEGVSNGISPLGGVSANSEGIWSGATASNPPGFALVAMDVAAGPDGARHEAFLYRAFDPIRGARSVLTWGPGEDDRLTLSRPVLTDNFEGLAAQPLDAGLLRLWIVSDDNFSAGQRTLLYAFDITL